MYHHDRHGRPLVVLITITAVALAGVRLGLDTTTGADADDLPARLAAAAGVVLIATSAWGWLAVVLTVIDHLRGSASGRRIVPAGLRRAVLVACGAALVLAAPDASYATRVNTVPAGDATVISGLPYPDRALGGPPLPPRRASGRHIVVRPGDSLWAITAALTPRHDPADLAGEVTRLYRLNREVVGPDPDLIHPGQRLRLPRAWSSSGRTDPQQPRKEQP